MSEIETASDVETEEFTDALYDEALDREQERTALLCFMGNPTLSRTDK